ncbi:MAG: hypothetical protein AAF830_07265 [Pseudomonadota bacterium]
MAETKEPIDVDEVQRVFGVRRAVAEEIATVLALGPDHRDSLRLAVLLVLAIGFGAGAVLLWPFLSDRTETNLFSLAGGATPLLYKTNLGFGMIAWVIGWIFAVGAFFYVLVSALPVQNRFRYALTFVTMNNIGWRWSRSSMIERLSEGAHALASADEYAVRWMIAETRQYTSFAVQLFMVGIVITSLETKTGDLYTATSYVRDPFIPFKGLQTHLWGEATRVQLGCNETSDGSSIVYEVHFGEMSRRVSSADPVPDTDYFDALEAVDAALRETNASFERWQWLGRNSLHPKCLATFNARYGAERVNRLLRVGELPSDTPGED